MPQRLTTSRKWRRRQSISPDRTNKIIESFTEIETKNDRPQLAAHIFLIIQYFQAQGITNHKAIARALNARGTQTANQRQWYPLTVKKSVE